MINAFIDGVQKTLGILANVPIKTGQPKIEQVPRKADVAGLIGVMFGATRGKITLNFEKPVIFHIMKQMLDEDHTEISSDVVDAVGEMTNQVYGTAKTILNEKGYTFEMAIPTVIHGNFEIHSVGDSATLVIPFSTPQDAEFTLELTIKKQ